MKRLALATSILAISVVSASAADITPKAYTKAPPPPPPPTWSGFYVGGNVGAVIEENRFTSFGTPGPCSGVLPGCFLQPNYSTLMAIAGTTFNTFDNRDRDHAAFLGGAQVGYNWQAYSNFVVGIEADIQGVASNRRDQTFILVTPSPAFPQFPLTTTAEVTEKLTYLGTVRGRVGWLATPAVLLYATGGLAYGEVRHTAFITQSIPADPTSFPVPGFGSFSDTRVGWTAGGGVEWLFSPNWSVKFEGLWFDLGRRDQVLSPTQIVSTAVPGTIVGSAFHTFSRRTEGGIARVGVNWHFGGPIISQY